MVRLTVTKKTHEPLAVNARGTHGVVKVMCWDGPHFFIKNLSTAHLRCRSKRFDDAVKLLRRW